MKPARDDLARALEITPHFYRAALDPSVWSSILPQFADAMGSPVAQFSLADSRSATTLSAFQHGISDEAMRAWLAIEDHEAIDPRIEKARGLPNRPHTERDLMSEAEWHASTIFREFLSRFGFDSTLVAYTSLEEEGVVGLLCVIREIGAQPFSAADYERFHLYLPHFREAMRVASRLYRVEARNRSYEALFDQLRIGAVATNRFGEVTYANEPARRLLDAPGGVSVSHGKLVAEASDDTRLLHARLFDAALKAANGDGKRQLIRVTRRDRGSDLLLSVTPIPLDTSETPLGHDLHAAVFLYDPEEVYEGDVEAFQRLYGLTHAQACVMQCIGSGLGAREAANRLAIGYETVRTHLKAVYQKTGVSSQSDLTRLVHSLQLPGKS